MEWSKDSLTKKAIAVILIICGLVLIILSSFNLFLIQRDNSTYRFLTAMTGSMEPTYFKGDVLKVDCTVPIDEIYAASKDAEPAGDIIAFQVGTSLLVHRAIEKTVNGDGTYSFRTQGDNTNFPDTGVVQEINVVGKVVDINPPFWTYNLLFWETLMLIGIILLVSGIMLIALTH